VIHIEIPESILLSTGTDPGGVRQGGEVLRRPEALRGRTDLLGPGGGDLRHAAGRFPFAGWAIGGSSLGPRRGGVGPGIHGWL